MPHLFFWVVHTLSVIILSSNSKAPFPFEAENSLLAATLCTSISPMNCLRPPGAPSGLSHEPRAQWPGLASHHIPVNLGSYVCFGLTWNISSFGGFWVSLSSPSSSPSTCISFHIPDPHLWVTLLSEVLLACRQTKKSSDKTGFRCCLAGQRFLLMKWAWRPAAMSGPGQSLSLLWWLFWRWLWLCV